MPRPKLCSLDGCDREAKSRGLCSGHYARWRTTGDVHADVPLGPYHGARRCEIDGCDERHYARGMCQDHYVRWWASNREGPPPPEGD